jgi:hypothetical protein
VSGTAEEWASWTGVEMPTAGPHLSPGALVPVEIDAERDVGRYVEPHLLVR